MQSLKEALISSPALALPGDEGIYVFDTDASNFSVGAVLSQKQDGEERVIAYASKALSRYERNYCVTRREMLAVVYYMRAFRQFLLGRKFLIRTNHAALQWMQKTPELIRQQAWWCEILQEFDYNIEHRAGRLHTNADAMSKRPCWQCGHSGEDEIGTDQFEEEIRIIRSIPDSLQDRDVQTSLPPWAESLFDNLKRGYIENGKYKCRAIHFQDPTIDSVWHPPNVMLRRKI